MKIKLSLILFFISFCSFSQSIENLKTATKKFYEANYLMDFETIVSYSHPEMVKDIGKDVILANIEKHYENDEFRLRLQLETVPFQYGEIKKIEGKSFCLVTFRNPMRYFFETKLMPEKAEEKAASLKEKLKTKEVKFEPARNSFNVSKTTTFVAVSDETTANQWKLFNLDDSTQDSGFRRIFGESISKELGL